VKGKLSNMLENGSGPVSCVKFNPADAGQLVTGSWDYTVWSVSDGYNATALSPHTGEPLNPFSSSVVVKLRFYLRGVEQLN
jgi:WD40 repeat protein